VIERVKKLMGK